MTCIPGGPFLMGSLPGQGFPADEQPQHTVNLSPYFIDTTEVTVSAYAACVNANECAPPTSESANWGVPRRMNHPVDGVFYSDAQAFCAWAGKQLPTEAQWERAARGTRGGTFPWGEAPLSCDYAHIYEGDDVGCGTGMTAEVGSYPLGNSDEGVADMAGNVTEWVSDWYSASYYSSSPEQDPTGPKVGTLRINKGGNAQLGPANLSSDQVRAAFRPTRPGDEATTHLGFRCVRPINRR